MLGDFSLCYWEHKADVLQKFILISFDVFQKEMFLLHMMLFIWSYKADSFVTFVFPVHASLYGLLLHLNEMVWNILGCLQFFWLSRSSDIQRVGYVIYISLWNLACVARKIRAKKFSFRVSSSSKLENDSILVDSFLNACSLIRAPADSRVGLCVTFPCLLRGNVLSGSALSLRCLCCSWVSVKKGSHCPLPISPETPPSS